jgi:callose synthase
LGVDRGFGKATWEILRMLLTGGPLFFIFHMGTKSHYFEHTLLAGGANYRATGRGFVTTHEDFGVLYRFFAGAVCVYAI